MVYNGNKRDKYEKKVNILERNNEGTNRNGQKKPYDEGTKRKKKSYIEKKQGYQKEIMKGQIETNTKNWLDEKTYYGTN